MSDQSDKKLMEKQQIEKSTAETFLDIYNERYSANFKIAKLGDTPDVECEDKRTGEELFLEITLLEDWDGDIRALLGRGQRRSTSPVTGFSAISFDQDTLSKLRERLESKLPANYGPNTALVIRQVGIPWSFQDYQRYAKRLLSQVFRGREQNYGAGVWILCWDTATWPAKEDIFLLSEVPVEESSEEPASFGNSDNVRAMVTYERFASEAFNEFVSREDVDLLHRIESPHGCEEAVLIAFMKDEPEDARREAIDFYRDQVVYYCICGNGKFSTGL